MCGLIGFIPKSRKEKKVGRHVIDQYQRQLERGQKGFGVMSIDKNSVEVQRATEPTKAIIDCYHSEKPIMLFHHRHPTSTENTMDQTHPFLVSHDELAYDYYVMHNGVINNDDELFKKHTEELGYTYKTLKTSSYGYHMYSKFNDSESLAIEVARYFDGLSNKINAIGTIAFIAVRIDKKTQKPLDIMWSRNGSNPLEVLENEHGLLIASNIESNFAQEVTENTCEIINLKKYFNTEGTINNIIHVENIEYGVKPIVPVVKIETKSKTETNSAIYEGLTKREIAFYRMAERVTQDIGDEIQELFETMSVRKVSDDEITAVASRLNDMLLERSEIADEKVRPFFDKQESDEILEMNYDFGEDEFNVNLRADESTRKFNEIIS